MHGPPRSEHRHSAQSVRQGARETILPAVLTIHEPGRISRRVSLTDHGPIRIGRGSQAEVTILDRESSRLHCELQLTGSVWTVADLGSLNGSYVNGKRIERDILHSGDEITIGLTRLKFTCAADEPAVGLQPLARPAPAAASLPVPVVTLELEPSPAPVPIETATRACSVCGAEFAAPADAQPPLLCPDCTQMSGAPAAPLAEAEKLVPLAQAEVIHLHNEDTIAEFLERHPGGAANVVFTWPQTLWYSLIVFALGYLLLWDPLHFLHMAHLLSAFYIVVILYKVLCVFLSTLRKWEVQIRPEQLAALRDEDLPVYTILVPLYKEREVARKIIRTLDRLDYPKDKLDVKLLLEPDDPATLEACVSAHLPAYCEVIVCPDSMPKTKPKACNHGLKRARGEYVVIYDAEDRPEPDQLKKAIVAFRQSGENVICLQAKLNYFNPRQNTLTRWFTIEYSTWFDLFLPGLHALRAPIPLGGTSNHFQTDVLQDIRGWDPFNVTEDCDLGIRLYKMGYRTHVLDSTTWEEANSRTGNWIRQRSRWVKGYIQTHLVHMRRPLKTLWQMGPWGMFSFLSSVGGLSLMLLLNPIFWAILMVYVGCWVVDLHNNAWNFAATWSLPFADRWVWQMWFDRPDFDTFWNAVSQVFYVTTLFLLAGNFFFIAMHVVACIKRRMFDLIPWALLTPFYWILISIGAWKGFVQLFFNPFYWEKTDHGLDDPHAVEMTGGRP